MTIFDQKALTEAVEPDTPEHHLWVSVLTKAAHDALYSSDWREARIAMEWFKRKSLNFTKVCEYAGKSPEYVYQKMIEQIEKRENHMESIRSGNKVYVKDALELRRGGKVFHTYYRQSGYKRGPYNKEKRKVGRPRKKDPRMVLRGSKGGRPKLYVV